MDTKPLNIKSKSSQKKNQKKMKISGIIVLTVVVICIVFLVGKAIFASNNMEIPVGIDTGTINSNTTTAPPVKTTKKATEVNAKTQSKTETTKTEESKSEESSSEENSTEESIPENNEKAYVTQYANLHTEPAQDAENIVCMSPNVEVNVLEKLDNGYWKIYFINIDGPHTGYLWGGYLQSQPLY